MPIPDPCKYCAYRYNDVEEGHNCRRLDKKITLSGGAILEWPGWAVEEAFQECGGRLAKPSVFGRLRYHLFM